MVLWTLPTLQIFGVTSPNFARYICQVCKVYKHRGPQVPWARKACVRRGVVSPLQSLQTFRSRTLGWQGLRSAGGGAKLSRPCKHRRHIPLVCKVCKVVSKVWSGDCEFANLISLGRGTSFANLANPRVQNPRWGWARTLQTLRTFGWAQNPRFGRLVFGDVGCQPSQALQTFGSRTLGLQMLQTLQSFGSRALGLQDLRPAGRGANFANLARLRGTRQGLQGLRLAVRGANFASSAN